MGAPHCKGAIAASDRPNAPRALNLPGPRMALALIIPALAIAAGCGEDNEPSSQAQPAAAVPEHAEHKTPWLDVSSEISPAQWLASRSNDVVRPLNDAEVLRIKSLLDKAHTLYRESQRMIANRAVQVEAMLRASGIEEPAFAALEGLSHVAGEAGQTEGFGAISQHYVNLRSKGLDREAALAELKHLYGARR